MKRPWALLLVHFLLISFNHTIRKPSVPTPQFPPVYSRRNVDDIFILFKLRKHTIKI